MRHLQSLLPLRHVAEMEGRIEGSAFYATFEGDGRAGLYPVPFKGFMKGLLERTAKGQAWRKTCRA